MRCGGLVVTGYWLVSLPLDRSSQDRISAQGLPTVRSVGRQIALLIMY